MDDGIQLEPSDSLKDVQSSDSVCHDGLLWLVEAHRDIRLGSQVIDRIRPCLLNAVHDRGEIAQLHVDQMYLFLKSSDVVPRAPPSACPVDLFPLLDEKLSKMASDKSSHSCNQ